MLSQGSPVSSILVYTVSPISTYLETKSEISQWTVITWTTKTSHRHVSILSPFCWPRRVPSKGKFGNTYWKQQHQLLWEQVTYQPFPKGQRIENSVPDPQQFI